LFRIEAKVAEATRPAIPSVEDLLAPGGRLAKLLDGYEYRPQQIEAADAIEDAIHHGAYCIVEAGTGVGKTVAYLIPALQAIAAGKKVVVSTYTVNLQEQLIHKDIPLVRALLPEVDVRPCLLKGKNRYLCRLEFENACADLFHSTAPRFEEVRRWVQQTEAGDASELPFTYVRWNEIAAGQDSCRGRECAYYGNCFYYKARRIASASNLIVVNHALLMTDIAAREQSGDSAALLPDYDVLIVDEAHHLEDAATSALSISLGDWEIPAFLDRMRRLSGMTHLGEEIASAEGLHGRLFAFASRRRQDCILTEIFQPDEMNDLRAIAADLAGALRRLGAALEERVALTEGLEKDRLVGLQQTAERLSSAVVEVLTPLDGRVLWCEVRSTSKSRSTSNEDQQSSVLLHSTPIELQELLANVLWSRAKCAVLTSATLATSDGFDYLKRRVGLNRPVREHMIGSPFDFASQAILYVPAHLPPPPKQFDPEYAGLLAEEMRSIIELTKGRAFLLFTSRRTLDAVYERLKGIIKYPLFRQGDMPPQQLLQAYRSSGHGVLLGNQTFWEGVDVQGAALSAVVIDRIPFAVPDSPITKARTEAVVAAGRDAFREISIPQAQIRLKQGFGRLIRTKTDRGIVCVLDSRLLSRSYGRLFINTLPPASRASSWPRVERFWYA